MASDQQFSFLTRLQWFGRILFACRVSLISAAAGLLLFGCVPQARDLFADITYGALPFSSFAWGMWLLFFLYVFLIWAFPLHYAARAVLERSSAWMISASLRRALRQAPDAKKLVEDELLRVRSEMSSVITWTPRALALAPFIAVLLGLYKSYGVIADTQAALEPSHEALWQIVTLLALNLTIGALFFGFLVVRRGLLRALFGSRERIGLAIAFASATIVTAAFVGAYLAPFDQAGAAPRALIVPFLFGSLIFLAAFLAYASDRMGAPLLLLAIVGAFAVTAFNTHFNDLRTLPKASSQLALRQIEIEKAVERWKRANHCDESGCPPALIVAAEGGASRAAFAAATALGDLFDRASELPDGSEGATSPARRIFAISGVSGGAFGAATIRTALWEALERGGGAPPCMVAPSVWFGARAEGALARVKHDWRACLQALVSGDYLSAAFVGLGFRDNLSPPAYLFSGPSLLKDDRAALVERAWESYFDNVVAGREPWPWDPAATVASEAATGLRRPFGYLAEALDRHEGNWLPALMLNGTSVNRGARIIAADIVSTQPSQSQGDAPPNGREALYPAAFDLFEMLSTPCPPGDVHGQACSQAHEGSHDIPDRRDGADVRLSTTAMLSARFPIVSPAGTIRAKGDEGKDGDRVVDGGYFENAGLTTALDVAQALHEHGVTPIVLWVQNNPTIPQDEIDASLDATAKATDKRRYVSDETGRVPQFPPRAASTPRLLGAWPGWLQAFFSLIEAPVDALTATRDGHALEADDLIQRWLQKTNRAACVKGDCRVQSSYFTFKMFKSPRFDASDKAPEWCRKLATRPQPIMSEVSMSWWLSQSVQAELDSQLCDVRNRQSLADLQARLAQTLR